MRITTDRSRGLARTDVLAMQPTQRPQRAQTPEERIAALRAALATERAALTPPRRRSSRSSRRSATSSASRTSGSDSSSSSCGRRSSSPRRSAWTARSLSSSSRRSFAGSIALERRAGACDDRGGAHRARRRSDVETTQGKRPLIKGVAIYWRQTLPMEERIEIPDPLFEQLVPPKAKPTRERASRRATKVGGSAAGSVESSYARAKYRTRRLAQGGQYHISRPTPMPPRDLPALPGSPVAAGEGHRRQVLRRAAALPPRGALRA